MTLVLEECGMRIGELCTLRLDCLSRDLEGEYFLRYHQPKMGKELQIPISRELALVIQEQQNAHRNRWGDSVTWLFSDRKGRPVPPNLIALQSTTSLTSTTCATPPAYCSACILMASATRWAAARCAAVLGS
jgi:integrase